MKRQNIVVLAAVLALAGSVVANEVLSRNAVGVLKVDVPASGITLVSTPFINIDGSEQTIEDIFGTSVPDRSAIHMWSGMKYDTFLYLDGLGWLDSSFTPARDVVIGRGQGVWYQNPTAEPLELVLTGEVPGVDDPVTDVILAEGLSIISFAYPVDINVDQANLTPNDRDVISMWDTNEKKYLTFIYLEGLGWLDEKFNPVSVESKPGRAYWYRSMATQTWDQQKPYTWP